MHSASAEATLTTCHKPPFQRRWKVACMAVLRKWLEGGGVVFPRAPLYRAPPLCDVPGSSTHPFQPQPGRVQQSTFQRFRFLVCQPVDVLVRCCLRRHAASASIFSFVGLLTAMPGCRMLVRGGSRYWPCGAATGGWSPTPGKTYRVRGAKKKKRGSRDGE